MGPNVLLISHNFFFSGSLLHLHEIHGVIESLQSNNHVSLDSLMALVLFLDKEHVLHGDIIDVFLSLSVRDMHFLLMDWSVLVVELIWVFILFELCVLINLPYQARSIWMLVSLIEVVVIVIVLISIVLVYVMVIVKGIMSNCLCLWI